MNPTDCCSQISKTNVFYKILIKGSDSYELIFEKDLTELQIIKNVIQIPKISCSTDEIIIRLKYLYACIEYGNCMRVMVLLPKIVDTLVDLCEGPIFKKVWSIVLQLLEKIMLTKEMATSWHPLLSEILIIPLAGFRYKTEPQASLVSAFLENIADVLPIEKTIEIICEFYMVTECVNQKEWDQLLWSLKLLSALAIQRGYEITPRHVRKVRETLVELTLDNCELVSSKSVCTLVDLYQNTQICVRKDRILQKLNNLIPSSMNLVREYYEKNYMYSSGYESDLDKTLVPEFPDYSVRSESEIITIACNIQPTTPIEQRKRALLDFCECIAYENCRTAIQQFRNIYLMLMRLLLCANTSLEITMVLDVIEKIFRCRPMKPYWTVHYGDILIKIIFSYNKDRKEIMDAIDLFIQNNAEMLPVTKTVNIVDALIASAEYPLKLCTMKILWAIAEQHKLFPNVYLIKILPTVVRAIDDPERNIRLSAESVIFKLCTRLGRQRIIYSIEKNFTMTTRLRILLKKIRRNSANID